jgi:hypothetical protein
MAMQGKTSRIVSQETARNARHSRMVSKKETAGIGIFQALMYAGSSLSVKSIHVVAVSTVKNTQYLLLSWHSGKQQSELLYEVFVRAEQS